MLEFNIAVDLDGPLADFNRHVWEQFGVHPDRAGDTLWPLVASVKDFWLTLPLKPHAHELWDFVQPYNPVILTGCPRSLYDIAAAQKVTYAKRHFGDDVRIITCLSRDKTQHIVAPGHILIDDFSSNCRRWRKAGGRAVYYRNFEQTITDLRKLLNEERPD